MTETSQTTIKTSAIKTSAIILVVLSALFYCYEYLLRISPSVMMPSIMHQFSLGVGGAGLLVGLYYWAYTPLQIVVGVITDRYGAKRILAWAIGLCVIGVALFPLTHNVAIAGLGRILIGVGSAFAYVGALSIANRTMGPSWFTFFAGAVTTLGMVGALAGDIGMGYMIEHFNWLDIFHIAIAAGVVLLIAFTVTTYINRKSAKPLPDRDKPVSFTALWKIISDKRFVLLGCIGALLFLSLDVFAELWGPQFIKVAKHTNIGHASFVSGFIFWGWAFGAPCQALFYKLFKSMRRCLIIESILAAFAITAALLLVPGNEHLLEGALFLFGFFCSAEVLCFSLAVQWVQKKTAATSVAVINFFVMLSGLIFQPLVSYMLQWVSGGNTSHAIYSAHDFSKVLIILPIACVAAFALSFALPKNALTEKVA